MGVDFANIQDIIIRVIGIIIIIVGGFVVFGGKKGDVRGSANSLLVVVMGAVIIAIGVGMMFPSIGSSIANSIFSAG